MTCDSHRVAHSREWATSPVQGAGLGLRSPHITGILETCPELPWFEILADNHTAPGGLIPAQLAAIRERYPLTFHCVGMSLAGSDPLDISYLGTIKRLAHAFQPAWISDHLCFTRYGEHHYHDLLPVPYTMETLRLISERIHRVQDFLGQPILVENVSSYLEFRESDLSEAQFIAELAKITDCSLLLDLNNIYVSAHNHKFNPLDYVDALPLNRVQEIHLAGYEDRGEYILDAHNSRVAEPVWVLYAHVMRRIPNVPTLIEWDNEIPHFDVLLNEAQQAAMVACEAAQHKSVAG